MNRRFVKYAIPSLIVYLFVLMAYYPGLLLNDSLVQWNQVQTGVFGDWHPAILSIIMYCLAYIWNSPTFILIIQIILLSLITGYILERIEDIFSIKHSQVVVASFVFPLIPINFNFAVTLFKDTLYGASLVLLSVSILDLISDDSFYKSKSKTTILFLSLLSVLFFRHNGIYVFVPLAVILLLVFRDKRLLYILCSAFLIYSFFTNVVYDAMGIAKGNSANKYAPVSHVIARMLSEENIEFTKEELSELEKYVDIVKLKETFHPYNMDYSINSQNNGYLETHGMEYLLFGVREIIKHPITFIKHYIYLDSYLYSPIPFDGQYTVGLGIDTDLWVYADAYPELQEASLLPGALALIKTIERKYNDGIIGVFSLRPALYMYLTIFLSIVMAKEKKDKRILLILSPILLNIVSFAIAMPVPMVRYAYPTIIMGYFMAVYGIDRLYVIFRNKRKNIQN